MSSLTVFLGRLIGLLLILVALPLAVHKQASLQILTSLVHDPPLLFVLGMVFLAAGLAIVLSHNVWSGGVLPVLVTLVGWITLIRGLLLCLSRQKLSREFWGRFTSNSSSGCTLPFHSSWAPI